MDAVQPFELPAVLTYLAARDWGPRIMRHLKGNGSQKTFDLDKDSAVMAEHVQNLVHRFEDHVTEDRENFAAINRTLVEIQKGQSRIEGILERLRP